MRRISAKSLENAAVFYLQRHSSSVKQTKRILSRKAQRVNRARKESVDFAPLVEQVVKKLESLGYLNDARLAQAKATALRGRGKSARTIRAKLVEGGLGDHLKSVHEPDADAACVWVFARKKRLGVYAKPESRATLRARHLAALVRAGFSFTLAKRVVDAGEPPRAE